MIPVEFPGCCTAKVITGFGQTGTAEYEYRPEDPLSHQTIARGIVGEMARYRRRGHATLVVTLNSQQKAGIEVLRALNWHVSPPIHKLAHPETQLHVCYCDLSSLEDPTELTKLDEIVASFA